MKKALVVKSLCLVLASGVLTGCAPLLIGGAVGTTAMVTVDRRTTGAQMADEVMETRIAYEISQAVPSGLHLTVTTYNRSVLLTGEVASQADKLKITRIAQRSLEVSRVMNELAVQPESSVSDRLADSVLANKVRAMLIGTEDVFLNQMKVTVDRGIVYLMGIVTKEEAQKATDIASRVNGVKSVVSALEVVSQQEIDRRMHFMNQQQTQATQETNNSSTEVVIQ